jgi:hypothetical protein
MKCDNIKKLIYLNYIELSEKERKLIKVHLSKCDSCSEFEKSIIKSGSILKRIKAIEPELTYPQVLTADIMESVRGKVKEDNFTLLKRIILDFLLSKKIRIAALVTVFGLISLFSYQQFFIIHKLNQMEKKIAVGSGNTANTITYPVVINNKVFEEFVSGVEDDQIILNRKSLDKLIKSYKELKTDHDELLELLNDNIKNLEKKLSERDIQKLKQLLEDKSEKKSSTNL